MSRRLFGVTQAELERHRRASLADRPQDDADLYPHDLPPIKGGQGRSHQDISDDATVAGMLFLASFAFVACAIIHFA